MNISIVSRIKRILKGMDNVTIYNGDSIVFNGSNVEDCIAEYRNNDASNDLILFALNAVYISFNGESSSLKYDEILSVESPENKGHVSGFNLITTGRKIWLPVRGKLNNHQFDAFEVVRLFDRIIEDIDEYKKKNQVAAYLSRE